MTKREKTQYKCNTSLSILYYIIRIHTCKYKLIPIHIRMCVCVCVCVRDSARTSLTTCGARVCKLIVMMKCLFVFIPYMV